MKISPLASNQWLGTAVALLCVAVLGALLTATIYWTLSDPMWIAFLGGVLIAAVLAAASRASTVEWRLARRTRKLADLRARLEKESKRSHAATAAFRAGEDRLRLLCDSLSSPVFFVDRERRCHLHNAAAAMAARCPHESIDGNPLAQTVGNGLDTAMEPFLAIAFSGRNAEQTLSWAGPHGAETYAAHYLPFPKNDPLPTGVFVVLERIAVATATPANDGAADLAYVHALSESEMDWDAQRAKLVEALEQNQFLLLAQPIVALARSEGEPECCEILLRLKEEEDNLLPPGSFFPVAERYGMIEELDRWVVRELITRCHGQPQARYCVNLSAASVRSHAFARFVQQQLLERSFAGANLCFEIAEHDLATCHAEAARLISMLKPFGCRFTVDGFGSAKGSFAALKGLPFDFLKIDGVVIQNMRRHRADLAKVRAIVKVCRIAGMRTIAEFVEDEETLVALRAAGVDFAQGFGIAIPAPLRSLNPQPAGAMPALAAAA